MFYDYHQNNSGGGFTTNANVAQIVIIEADSASEADERAQGVGIYFDENYEIDCDCCGTRWSSKDGWYEDKGTETPTIYGQELSEVGDDLVHYTPYGGWTDPYGYVYYRDGSKKTIKDVKKG